MNPGAVHESQGWAPRPDECRSGKSLPHPGRLLKDKGAPSERFFLASASIAAYMLQSTRKLSLALKMTMKMPTAVMTSQGSQVSLKNDQ